MTTLLGVSLAGRRVVMVGGGRVTARRMARFLDDGAQLTIISPALAPETRALVDAHHLTWCARAFASEDVEDAWLVHTATGDPTVDQAVADASERHRVLCVNASAGPHGSAVMSAETRSGDLVVGVVSDGTVDPRRTARVRNAVSELLTTGGLPVGRRRRRRLGRVDLVGGGPGPADLITVRGRRLLAEADVVVVDRLGPGRSVTPDLDPDTLVIDVGKRPGHHPVPQEEINALLIQHALAGEHVVRLKGGDPFVFGRGGEEVGACMAAGVPVEVVPGVSSALAVPQAAGIPVTHRGVAQAVHVANGHAKPSPATVAALTDPTVTCVFLMGVAALSDIAATARAHGVPDDRPVAIVESGHTEHQRTTRTKLCDVVARAGEVGVRSPAVVIFGDVAAAGILAADFEAVR